MDSKVKFVDEKIFLNNKKINYITITGITIIIIYIIKKVLDFYGLSISFYGSYISFYIFLIITYMIIPVGNYAPLRPPASM